MIPVVDIFAGPGGLSEGFAAVRYRKERLFDIRLSIENQDHAFRTLQLRAFFRSFCNRSVPDEYYRFMRNEIDEKELYRAWPEQAAKATEQTLKATLGECDQSEIDEHISNAIKGFHQWILIGGPPCQAYSFAGIVGNRTKKDYKAENDSRYRLYREYIRVLAAHSPTAFVLENVPGILSAKLGPHNLIDDVLRGLSSPSDFAVKEFGHWPDGPRYKLLSLASGIQGIGGDPAAFLMHAQEYGIPQSRRRIIIVGIREDIDPSNFRPLRKVHSGGIDVVINDLPPLRSRLSREQDSEQSWCTVFANIEQEQWIDELCQLHGRRLTNHLLRCAKKLRAGSQFQTGGSFIPCKPSPLLKPRWFIDSRLKGISHHETRPHIRQDLHRYLFCACFGKIKGQSPKLPDFPPSLLPNHRNSLSGSFKDRFRVLLRDRPSGTIISHLSKDGHAFIHPDPLQCRSITPREAARLQTFPDNYFFFGGRASQMRQIGNAVPPLLARLIAKALVDILRI